MRKKVKTMLLAIGTTVLTAVALAGCRMDQNKTKTTPSFFTGLKEEIPISCTVETYDFAQNVLCFSESRQPCEFSVDDSKVSFGTVGSYEITYSSGDLKKTATVKIYDTPKFDYEQITLTYEEANSANVFADKISCKDSFGNELTVEYGELIFENGALKIGQNALTVTAKDDAGNEASEQIPVQVQAPTANLSFEDKAVDFAKATLTLECGERDILSIWYKGEAIDEKTYIFNNGHILLLPEFFEWAGVTEDERLYLNFSDCSSSFELSITDDATVSYELDVDHTEEIYMPNTEIVAPKATLDEYSIQSVEFRYYFVDGEKREMVLGDTLQLSPSDKTYQYVIEIYKNEELSQTVTQTFYGSADKYFAQDFATEKMLQNWLSSGNSESNRYGTVSFEREITRGAETKAAIKYYTSYNFGNWGSGVGNPENLAGIYLDKAVIEGAKAAGYDKITFSYTTDKTPTTGSLSGRFSVCDHSGSPSSVINGYAGYLSRNNGAASEWNTATIELSALTKGTIAFACWGDSLYLADVRFEKPFVPDFTKDFASAEMAEAWTYYGSQAVVSYENNINADGTTAEEGAGVNAIKLYGANHTADFNYGDKYLSAFYLKTEVAAKLIEEGYTKMTITFSYIKDNATTSNTPSYRVYLTDDYDGSGNTMKHSVYNPKCTYLNNNGTAAETWVTKTVDLNMSEGNTIAIAWWMQTMYISSITFSK